MPDLDERVVRLEERSGAHTRNMEHLRTEMIELRREMHALREDMDRRLDRMDGRINWLTGVVITGFITVIGTIAGAFWGVLQIVR
jgi:uncharacterized coiled-coil protein SlyX